jgi:hypothetical protein
MQVEDSGIDVSMRYVVRGEKAIFTVADRARAYWPEEFHPVTVRDLRPIREQLSFDRNGFMLLTEPTACRNFYDADEVERVYVPEVKALVARLTGAHKVITFGIMTRGDAAGTSDGRKPAFGAHVDYGARTVRDMAESLLGVAEADRLLAGRHMLINLWRPIRTVERSPLAVCDASTVLREDLFDSEVVGGLGDSGRSSLFGFNLAYNPIHRWYYVPRMQPDEVLVFKLFDSKTDAVQLTAHSAIEDPTAAPDAPPRESIELRTLSFLS